MAHLISKQLINFILQFKKLNNPELAKMLSMVIGASVNSEAIGATLPLSANENNWLTHYDQDSFLKDYQAFKEGDTSWEEWVRKLTYYNRLMWYEYNDVYGGDNSTEELLKNDVETRGDGYLLGSGSFQDVMNNMIYRYVTSVGYKDLFDDYSQEASNKIVGTHKVMEDYELGALIRENDVDTGHAIYDSSKLVQQSKSSTTDLEKSVLTNTAVELTKQPIEGYIHYNEDAGVVVRGLAKVGGALGAADFANNIYQDYYIYSGTNLLKAWSTNLIPPIYSAVGGVVGTGEGITVGYATRQPWGQLF